MKITRNKSSPVYKPLNSMYKPWVYILRFLVSQYNDNCCVFLLTEFETSKCLKTGLPKEDIQRYCIYLLLQEAMFLFKWIE